jgi:hypothetical protein
MLLVAACLRRVWDWLVDPRTRKAVEVAEKFADGLATEVQLKKARETGLRVFSEPGDLLPREPHWKMYAFPVEAACMDESINDALNYVAEATAWSKVGTPDAVNEPEKRSQAQLVREIFGNPFRPVPFSSSWRNDTALALARQMYESREYSAMPILADALQDAGRDNEDILDHCRGPGPRVRGCWVVDLVLGKE